MEYRCPYCNSELEVREDTTLGDENYYCNKCYREVEPEIYEDIRVCPVCDTELTVIIGCGIDDYYCEKCGKTILKEDLKIDFRKL